MNTETKIKRKRKHIGEFEYFTIMEKYVNGELTDEQIRDLEEDIKTWELFRITKLIGMSSYDVDGVPTPIIKKILKDINMWDFNGGEDGNKYINCFDVTQFTENEDNKELHSSTQSNHKNIGEYYRTLRHQSMVYNIHIR
jgi:hypothetical protein